MISLDTEGIFFLREKKEPLLSNLLKMARHLANKA